MPLTHRLAATLLLTLGLALAGLTACAKEEPVPKFAEEPTAAPTPVEKKETPKEFIRRWNDEQARMQKGDTTEYRKIAGECEPCMSAADNVDAYYAAGGYVETEGREILSIRKDAKSSPLAYLVDIDSAPTELKESAEAPLTTFSGGKNRFRVLLKQTDSGWALVHYDLVPM